MSNDEQHTKIHQPVNPSDEQKEASPNKASVQKNKSSKPTKKTPKRKQKLPLWARILLRTLRFMIVPALCVGALIAGLIVGYVYIGGQEMNEVWKIQTWKHVFDLIFA